MADADEIEKIRGLLQGGDPALDDAINVHNALRAHRFRTEIGKYVICTYLGVVVIVAIYLIVRGLWCGESEFANLFELIKVALVPIVTLVIGYYFGTAEK